jgi:large subunit ribosomal protein L9
MKVILKEDVENLGQLGDIKEVAAGYARNFLIPRNLVIAATVKNVAEVEHERRLIEARLVTRRAGSQAKADKIAGITISVTVKVGEDGRLFGSVTAKDLMANLAEQGVELDRHGIVLDNPIKSVGDRTVSVNLGHGVKADLKVSVVAEATEEAPEAVTEEVEADA